MLLLQTSCITRVSAAAPKDLPTESSTPAVCTAECCSRCEFFTCDLAENTTAGEVNFTTLGMNLLMVPVMVRVYFTRFPGLFFQLK